MFEQYVAPILHKYLSAFIANLPELKLSVWSGQVVLSNLQIKPNAFVGLLPFTIVGGYIAELRITIPWSSLTSTPVQVWLKRVDLNVSFGAPAPAPARPRSGSMERSVSMSDAAMAANPFAVPVDSPAADEGASSGGGGWTASIATKIVNNVEIKVESLTVRLFDTDSEDSATFTMGSLHLYSCDGNFSGRLFVEPTLLEYTRKVCRAEDISLVISSLSSDSTIVAGVSATVRVEHVGAVRQASMTPADSPTTRVDIRVAELHATLEDSQLAFLVRAITQLTGGGADVADAVEAELRRTMRPVSNLASMSARTPSRAAPTAAAASAGGGWVGWIMGSDVPATAAAAAAAPPVDLLQFDGGAGAGGAAAAAAATVTRVCVGVFAQEARVTLREANTPPLSLAVTAFALESRDGAITVAMDNAEVRFGDHTIATIGAAPATMPTATTSATTTTPTKGGASPPAAREQWAFELFASASGAGNRSISMDTSKRLFLPDSLFDPNGSRLFEAAGLDAGTSGNGDDASFVVGEFGNGPPLSPRGASGSLLDLTPRKLGRSPNEKPSFTSSARQPLWQQGSGVTAPAWHSFAAVLLRSGPALVEDGDAAAWAKRPVHRTVSVCVDAVQAALLPEAVAFAVRFLSRTPLGSSSSSSSSSVDAGLDAMAPSFEALLDHAMSRVWRTPGTSFEVRVASVRGEMDTSAAGWPGGVALTARRVVVTDNWRGAHYPGADVVAQARSYRSHAGFALRGRTRAEALQLLLSTITVRVDAPQLSVGGAGGVCVLAANGAQLQLAIAGSRVPRLLDHMGVDVGLRGAFALALAPAHLQLLAWCLNVLMGRASLALPPPPPSLLPVPGATATMDFLRARASDLSLRLAPDGVEVAVQVAQLMRDGFRDGPILVPWAGRDMAALSLTLGYACESPLTLARSFWQSPRMAVSLQGAVLALDQEALLGWLVLGLEAPPDAAPTETVAAGPAAVGVVPRAVFEMLSWEWQVDVRDVTVALGRALALHLSGVTVARDAASGQLAAVLRGLTVGAAASPGCSVALEAAVACERAPYPTLRVTLSCGPIAARLAPGELEAMLAVALELRANAMARSARYAHCWGAAVLARSTTPSATYVAALAAAPPQSDAAAPPSLLLMAPEPPPPALGVALDVRARLPSVDAAVPLAGPSRLTLRAAALELHALLGSPTRAELVLGCGALNATFGMASERHQLSLACTRAQLRDTRAQGERAFKLELHALGIDRLNDVGPGGVAVSADAVLQPVDVSVVRRSSAATTTGIGPAHAAAESGFRVACSPCTAMIDEQTVGTVQSLLRAIALLRRQAAPKDGGVTASAVAVAAAAESESGGDDDGSDDANADLSCELECVSLCVGAYAGGAWTSRMALSGLAATRRAGQLRVTLRHMQWASAQDATRVYVQSTANVPFVTVAARRGGDVTLEIAGLTGRLPSELLHCVVRVLQGGEPRQPQHAPHAAMADDVHQMDDTVDGDAPIPLLPQLASLLLLPFARCKVLVAPWTLAVATRAGAELRVGFEQMFLSTHWSDSTHGDGGVAGAAADGRAWHVGSATVVGLRVTSSETHCALLEPLTLMAELSLSSACADVQGSVTHPVRINVRPADGVLFSTLATEIGGESAPAMNNAAAVPVRPDVVLPRRAVAASALVTQTDVLAGMALVGDADGRHPDVGECVVGLERRNDGTVCSFAAWRTAAPHAVTRVYQRHAVPSMPPHCVAVVQLQQWDAHGRRWATAGSLLLSGARDAAAWAGHCCVFPAGGPRAPQWRLHCHMRATHGGLPAPLDAVVAPPLLLSALAVDTAQCAPGRAGDASLALVVPRVSVYLAHAYRRELDGAPEEEEVVLLSVAGLRVADTTGDARVSVCASAVSLKCVQFDDLSLVDLVEPASVTAVRHSPAGAPPQWDVRVARVAINASPALAATLARYAALWRPDAAAVRDEFAFCHYALHNRCAVALACGQARTGECVALAPRARHKYAWQVGASESRLLEVWLPDDSQARATLDIDGCLPDGRASVELRVQLGAYAMFVRVERAATAPRVVIFLGSYLFHSTLPFALSLSVTTREPQRDAVTQTLAMAPHEAVGLLMTAAAAVHTAVAFAGPGRGGIGPAVPYALNMALGDVDEGESRRELVEAGDARPRFWACQSGRRLSLVPLLTVWNCTPCAVWVSCSGAHAADTEHSHVQPGAQAALARVALAGGSTLAFAFDTARRESSAPYPLTLDVLRSAADVPQSAELRCGRHAVVLSLYAERVLGGVVAVLHARCVVRNESALDMEAFAGATPRYPEDRVVVAASPSGAGEPASRVALPAMALTMVAWDAHVATVSFRAHGNESADEWRDVHAPGTSTAAAATGAGDGATSAVAAAATGAGSDGDDVVAPPVAAGAGVALTLRGRAFEPPAHQLRHPLLVRFAQRDIPIPSTRARLAASTLTVTAAMVMHSALDCAVRVRVGCGRAQHSRCRTGVAFALAPHAARELTGFGFGFHVSVATAPVIVGEPDVVWSHALLCGREAPRTPIAWDPRAGAADGALCYSVVRAPSGVLHCTIMRDAMPPLRVRNLTAHALRVSVLEQPLVAPASTAAAATAASVPAAPVVVELLAGAGVVLPLPAGSAAPKLVVGDAAPLLVEGDGDGELQQLPHPIYFRIASVMGARTVTLAAVPFARPRPLAPASALAFGRVSVQVDELSVSLFDDRADVEYLRLTLVAPSLDVSRRRNPNLYSAVHVLTDVSATAAALQLDNHSVEGAEFPVVAAPLSVVRRSAPAAKAWLSVRASFGFCAAAARDDGLHVEECTVAVQPLVVYVGEAFVLYAQRQLELVTEALAAADGRADATAPAEGGLALGLRVRAASVPAPPLADAAGGWKARFDAIAAPAEVAAAAPLVARETATPPYIHYLKIGAMQFRVTLHFNVPRVHVHLGMDDSPVATREVVMHRVAMPPHDLLTNLLSLYVADVIARSPSLLGSLQILGNPTSFLSNLADGVYDLLAMPLRGVRDLDALGAVVGMGRGGASFVRHLSVGTLRSFSGWFTAVAKNMDALTMDEAYLLKHIQQRAVSSRAGLGGSLVAGMTGLGSAVLDGVTGLVAQPVAGAHAGGVRGAMVGGALGVLNVFVKPLGGAVQLVGSLATGALNAAGGGSYAERRAPGRKRRVLVVHADIKWRRKYPSDAFVAAFDVTEGARGACVVVFTRQPAALQLVQRDVVVHSVARGEAGEVRELAGPVFCVATLRLSVARGDRREFARCLKDVLDAKQ